MAAAGKPWSLHVFLVKPSKYDDDGYVVRHMFHRLVERGTYVEKGMKVGTVTDDLGQTIGKRAPEAGVVLYVRAIPSLPKGDTVASIGVVAR